MSDDKMEKTLEELTPRRASSKLRGRILGAVQRELPLSDLGEDQPHLEEKKKAKMLRKRLVFAVLLVAALVPTYLLGNTVWIWTTTTRLQEKLAAVKKAGDPVTLADLSQPNLQVEDNAAVLLQKAEKEIATMLKQLAPILGREDYRTDKLTEDENKQLRTLLQENTNVLKLVEQSGDCSTYYPSLDYKAKPTDVQAAALADANDFRRVMALLEVRSRFQLEEGKLHESLQTCMLQLRLVRRYDGCLFLVNSLVACAGRAVAVSGCNRVMRTGPIADKDRDALETELILHDGHAAFVNALKKERAYGITSFDGMKNFWNRAVFDNDESCYLDLMQVQMDLTAKPYGDFIKWMDNYKAAPVRTANLTALMVPAVQKTREADERTRGVMRCLRVLNALQRAGIAPEKGEPNLANLKMPGEATTDPFTDKPLHVKVVDGQWLIYTVGPDLKDDGGDLANNKDFGVGPITAVKK